MIGNARGRNSLGAKWLEMINLFGEHTLFEILIIHSSVSTRDNLNIWTNESVTPEEQPGLEIGFKYYCL